MIAALLAAAVCAHAAGRPVRFKSDDGWTIAAVYSPPRRGRPTAIMVHGVAAGHGEYDAFSSTLQAHGWGTLALDLRGHGGSTAGPRGKQTFMSFDASGEWPHAVYDVLAARRFLAGLGVKERSTVLIGASIGANLCARAFAAMPNVRRLVLLSPGFDYRGVTLPARGPSGVIAAASPGDPYAAATLEALRKSWPSLTALSARSGHGAQMFSDPAFVRALLRALTVPKLIGILRR
ncbi:MAG: alpha/beta fold hydrolase [Elusimicrobia bacterium]|nr:alpha/beta fold hydrolase [Elusimicrobiota bacterium]MDE2236390.1 alpha/beta fold hydrolase [Elusimicrobiota bacterium]MDE2426571.1 alpha/beta fold hydrolase [Elusimicrobiota bacterium]